ncbi:MAG: galactitol-1-phosphate 5-dehydrogenase [Chloroflexales bacterium]|nr:galactitol-1-phosphate 5-dehydrogenase [Chloroflexales bacterium]
MKAAILEGQGIISYRDVPEPTPKAGQVLLQVRAASICGSDIHRYTRGHREYPMILGHEVAGVIAAVGEGVAPDLLGRRAAIIPLVPCHACAQCQAGRYSACASYSFIGSRQAGGFADYVALPARNALLVPDGMPFEDAALIEPATVGRHILDLGAFAPGQTTVVFGAGSIGLMIVQWLRILGAGVIIVSDVSDAGLEAARALGAHVTLNPARDDVPAEARRLTYGGADLVLEATGAPAALAQTIQAARPRGVVVLGGNQPLEESLPMSFIEDMMRKELRLVGCFMSYSAPFPGHEWADAAREALDGGLDMPAMISHRFPLAEAPRVFAEIGAHRLAHRKIIFELDASREAL